MFKTRVLNLDKVLTSVEQSIKKVNTSLVKTDRVEPEGDGVLSDKAQIQESSIAFLILVL
jgi:hypothetical protein